MAMPLLAEAGALIFETIGSAVAEATSSEVAGAYVANSAKGSALGALTKTVGQGVEKTIDTVFGQGTSNEIKTQVPGFAGNINDYSASGMGFGNFDEQSVLKNLARKRHEDFQRSIASVPKDEEPLPVPGRDGFVPDIEASKMKPSGLQFHNFAKTISNDAVDDTGRDLSFQKNINLILNASFYDPTEQASVLTDVNKAYNPTEKPPKIDSKLLHTDPVTKKVTNPKKIGLDVGKLIGLHAINVSKNTDAPMNPDDALKEISVFHPELNHLIVPLLDYQSGIKLPTTQKFKDIYKVYTGRSLSIDKMNVTFDPVDGLQIFSAYDEVGTLYTFKENPNGFKIPTINGVWTGPSSANNALPTNILDLMAFFHDCDYHPDRDGWFSLEGDLKFISRLAQNLDRMSDAERVLAKFSINYFSTIGNTLANLKNSLSPRVANEVIRDSSRDDIFPVLVPEAKSVPNYNEMRYAFYNGVIEGLQTVAIEQSPLSSHPVASNIVFMNQLENLQIEIL